jgi:hypothetical protein
LEQNWLALRRFLCHSQPSDALAILGRLSVHPSYFIACAVFPLPLEVEARGRCCRDPTPLG